MVRALPGKRSRGVRLFRERFVVEAANEYDRLSESEREEVDRCLDHAYANPEPDGDRIVVTHFGTLTARLLVCEERQILFVLDRGEIWVLSLSGTPELPPDRR